MMMLNNNIEIPFGKWNSSIILHEENKTYSYNYFMEYWEDSKGKFYRWLNKQDLKNINEHKEYYYNSLDSIPF